MIEVKDFKAVMDSTYADTVGENVIKDSVNIKDFKLAADEINNQRSMARTELETLTNNLYSTINQMNFSIKMITDTDRFVNKYIGKADRLLTQLTKSLTEENDNVYIDMYNAVLFNNNFVNSILAFENFSKIVMEAISDYLINTYDDEGDDISLKDIHSVYCDSVSIDNEWDIHSIIYSDFKNEYGSLFSINNILDISVMTESQIGNLTQYELYKKTHDDLDTIFQSDNINAVILRSDTIPALIGIIDFKFDTLYNKYVSKLSNAIVETTDLFNRITNYIDLVIKHNVEYQSTFREDNQYITVLIDVCNSVSELLSIILLKYPNRDSYNKLITDEDFNIVLNIVETIRLREIEAMKKLLDLSVKDYRLIRSLETFIVTQKIINNSTLFNIMSNFDNELNYINSGDNEDYEFVLGDAVRLFFGLKRASYPDTFDKESFTDILSKANVLTDPFYDIANYFRVFLFKFTKDPSMIFDLLESLHIFNLSLTNKAFDNSMKDLFDIKINEVDYINVNKSNINESITSKYDEFNVINHVDLTPYVEAIISMDTSSPITIQDIDTAFESFNNYNSIIFIITESILYGNVNIELVRNTLQTKLNIRTSIFDILFLISMNRIKTSMEEFYPDGMEQGTTIYDVHKEITSNQSDATADIKYLKILLEANKYYKGQSEVFNIDNIMDLDPLSVTSIWDNNKVAHVEKILSIHREV